MSDTNSTLNGHTDHFQAEQQQQQNPYNTFIQDENTQYGGANGKTETERSTTFAVSDPSSRSTTFDNEEGKPNMKKSLSTDKVNVSVSEKQLSDRLGDANMNILPRKKLIICLSALALSMVISFADQQGITVAMTEIGSDLHAEQTINWAGTASLLANTVCQVLFGRLSDIFGRKKILLFCLATLVISDVACGCAQTGLQFYIFRAGAGMYDF